MPTIAIKPVEGRTYDLVRRQHGQVRRILERPTEVDKTPDVIRALRRGDIALASAADMAAPEPKKKGSAPDKEASR